VIYLALKWSESNKSTRLLHTEDTTIASMGNGATSLDHINVKNAITTFRRKYSSVASVGSWLVINAEETDYEEPLRLEDERLALTRGIPY